jgi:hypothetical protein
MHRLGEAAFELALDPISGGRSTHACQQQHDRTEHRVRFCRMYWHGQSIQLIKVSCDFQAANLGRAPPGKEALAGSA